MFGRRERGGWFACAKTLRDYSILEHGSSIVHALAFSPNGEILATTGSDNKINVYVGRASEAIRTLAGATTRIYHSTF